MTYEAFLRQVRKAVREKLGDEYLVRLKRITKDNGRSRDGLIIRRMGEEIAPIVYLDEAYEKIREGMPVTEFADQILGLAIGKKAGLFVSGEQFSDPSWVSKRVVWRLIHAERNKELLEKIPFIPFLDLAIVFGIYVEDKEDGLAIARIENRHLFQWGMTVFDLYEMAEENTPLLLPAEFLDLPDLSEAYGGFAPGDACWPQWIGLTNTSRCFGAGVILYDGLLKRVSDCYGTDLLLLPVSVHGFAAVPGGKAYGDEIRNRLRLKMNQEEEDFLSDQMYCYIKETKQIELWRKQGGIRI